MSETSNPAGGEQLTGHLYDGIQEYDNPLPGWWTWLFVGTVVFSVLYQLVMWFQADNVSVLAGYEASKTRMLQQQFASLGELEPTQDTLLRFMTDPEERKWLDVGKAVFVTNCISCHGKDGNGISGPNLTDDVYKNVKTLADIPKVVTNGANAGAMPAWGNRLLPNEIVLVSAYVASLRGKNLPNGGFPQDPYGERIEPWPSN